MRLYKLIQISQQCAICNDLQWVCVVMAYLSSTLDVRGVRVMALLQLDGLDEKKNKKTVWPVMAINPPCN